MNKVAYFKEEIYKTAARAWKKHLGDIGEEGVNKLINSGIFDRGKELKGLKKGTDKILGKNNAKLYRKAEPAAGQVAKKTWERFLDTVDPKELSDTDIWAPGELLETMTEAKRTMMNQMRNMGPFGSPTASGAGKSAVAYVPKNAGNHVKELLNKNYGPGVISKTPRKDRESKKWLQAILDRHEADEVRTGTKIYKNKNKMADMGSGMDQHITGFYSHMTPKVLASESANVALAPKGAKKYMNELRNIDIPGWPGTEASSFAENTGIEYGKSGVYNRLKASQGEKKILKENKKTIKEMLDD